VTLDRAPQWTFGKEWPLPVERPWWEDSRRGSEGRLWSECAAAQGLCDVWI